MIVAMKWLFGDYLMTHETLFMKRTEALKKIVEAWDSLPMGDYSHKVIASWLINPMAPAIADAREVLKDGQD